MKAMARHRSHSIEFKRQVAQEFIAGESLYALSKRHDISRQLIRVWVQKYEAGRRRPGCRSTPGIRSQDCGVGAHGCALVHRRARFERFIRGALKLMINPPPSRSRSRL